MSDTTENTNGAGGKVFVQTNEAGGNSVIAFRRGGDGTLVLLDSFATGGAGDGVPHLTSQGSVTLTGDGKRLLVANAGSGELSLFAVREDGLELVHTVSVGAAPKSVTEHGGLVYVLNTGDPSLAGFRLGGRGLEPLAESTRALPEGSDPAQVGFTPDGSTLVVTDRGTNSILSYPVEGDGVLGEPRTSPSSGPTPYGFAFASNGTLVVTEAFGAEKGKAAASSYRLDHGQAAPVSASVGNGRSEICWAVVTKDDRYVFTTNFADGAVSRYAIGSDRAITLDDAVAGTAVDGETGLRDEDLSRDGRFLYAIDADAGKVRGWAVGDAGALTAIGSWEGVPATVGGPRSRLGSAVVADPTDYPELNDVLEELVAEVRTILGGNFCGAYLQGSFAVGDADVHSDVDFIVATNDELTDEQLAALQAMHKRIYSLDSPWTQHLEGSYVPKDALRHVDPARSPYWYLDNGSSELVRDNHCNTAVVRWSLREHGVVLEGPDPKSLVEPVTPAQLRAEARSGIDEFVAWARTPDMSRWKQPYLVLTFCRLLHTRNAGIVASKREAGEWALQALDTEWASLIQRALDDRPDPWLRVYQPADPEVIARTLEFADYAASSAVTSS